MKQGPSNLDSKIYDILEHNVEGWSMSGCFGLTHHCISKHSHIDPPVRNVELLLLRPFFKLDMSSIIRKVGLLERIALKIL